MEIPISVCLYVARHKFEPRPRPSFFSSNLMLNFCFKITNQRLGVIINKLLNFSTFNNDMSCHNFLVDHFLHYREDKKWRDRNN